jgi:hypothetical protein
MRPLKSVLSDVANWFTRPLGVAVVPAHKWAALRTDPEESFRFGGHDYPFFLHHYNCGRHPMLASERTVELALADRWLTRAPADRVCEVGAVTPYYWPGRVARVVDPADPHPQVTTRRSVLDLDMRGLAVLSVSTMEHVGAGEYDLPPDPTALRRAVDKLCAEAEAFLVTMPAGYNPLADKVLFDDPLPDQVTARYLVRTAGAPYWREVTDRAEARRPYGPAGGLNSRWANAVCVWERGGYLDAPPRTGG